MCCVSVCTTDSPPVGQYLLDAPLAAVTGLCLCGSASVRLEHLDAALFCHPALPNSSSAVRLFWGVRSSF